MTGLKVLSNVVHQSKHAKLKENYKKETFDETCDRYLDFIKYHIESNNFNNKHKLIDNLTYDVNYFMKNKLILPSMRTFQFAGDSSDEYHNRNYNCKFRLADSPSFFSSTLFDLLCGTGVGYSVMKLHTEKIGVVNKVKGEKYFLIEDSIMGWAKAIEEYFGWVYGKNKKPIFDYSIIRPKGTPLKTAGGLAPGPEPLKQAIDKIDNIINSVNNRPLRPIEVHDIICILSDCVVSGGTRRSALISIFDYEDEDMFYSKTLDNITKHPYRSRANNSACLSKTWPESVIKERLTKILKTAYYNIGEPGFYFIDDLEAILKGKKEFLGPNPCVEIGLEDENNCNLTTSNASKVNSIFEFREISKAQTRIGTLQSTLTSNMNYPNKEDVKKTKKILDKTRLLGCSITGVAYKNFINNNTLIASLPSIVHSMVLQNEEYCNMLRINKSNRITAIKPEGSTSCILETTSGSHYGYAEYYIRRTMYSKDEEIYSYLNGTVPRLLEQSTLNENNVYFTIPINLNNNYMLVENETIEESLERYLMLMKNWVLPGHYKGDGTNNVSQTIYIKQESDIDTIVNFTIKNLPYMRALSFLKYDGNQYKHMPFEKITKEKYDDLNQILDSVPLDFSQVSYKKDTRKVDIDCGGHSCDLNREE